MKKLISLAAVVFAIAIVAALAGCASTPASNSNGSSSSVKTTQLTADELVKEFDANKKTTADLKSVTMEIKGQTVIESSAFEDESASAASASATSTAASSAATSSSASAATEEDSTLTLPVKITGEFDNSGTTAKSHIKTAIFDQDVELYTTGSDTILVLGDQAISGSLEDFGMIQFAGVEAILESQGVVFTEMKDLIKTAEKTEDGKTVTYKITFDPAKFEESEGKNPESNLAKVNNAELDKVEYVVKVDEKGNLLSISSCIAGKGYDSDLDITFTDLNSTTVPAAPKATMTFDEFTKEIEKSANEAVAEFEKFLNSPDAIVALVAIFGDEKSAEQLSQVLNDPEVQKAADEFFNDPEVKKAIDELFADEEADASNSAASASAESASAESASADSANANKAA